MPNAKVGVRWGGAVDEVLKGVESPGNCSVHMLRNIKAKKPQFSTPEKFSAPLRAAAFHDAGHHRRRARRVARGTFQQAHGRVELEAEPGDYGARVPLLWDRGYEPELDDDVVPAAEKADQSIRADG